MSRKLASDSPEVVFLFGAGASVSFGIPAMGGMFEAFMSGQESKIDENDQRICQTLTEKFKVERDLEEFLLAANSIVGFKKTTLSKFVELAVSRKGKSSLLNKYKKNLRKDIADVNRVRNRVFKFIADTCFTFDRAKAHNVLSGFVKEVALCGYPVYTTNYDFVFEEVADTCKIVVHDNFIHEEDRDIWNNEIDFAYGNGLTLVKLHGSVTWYVDDSGNIEKVKYDINRNVLGRNVNRIVIFPTRFKDIYQQRFFALYSHFLSTLRRAKCLIVVGHSLRDDYLRAGIVERYRKGNLDVVIVDPSPPRQLKEEVTFAQDGKAERVTYVPMAFEDFSDDLANIIQTVAPAGIAQACADVGRRAKSGTNRMKIRGDIRQLRPNEKKTFKVDIDMYIPWNKRSVCVRVWLEANVPTSSGERQKRFSVSFIEVGQVKLTTGRGGMVQRELDVNIVVPEIPQWFELSDKVVLRVGVLSKYVKEPRFAANNTIAQASRKLKYLK